MKQFISLIATGWDMMRWLRLGLGAVVILEALKSSDSFLAILGAIFVMQAVFNVGCCGTSACAPAKRKDKADASDEIKFEEVK